MQDRLEIEEVCVRGYREIEDASVRLGSLNVIVGPNGSGKSSFLDMLSFLSEAVGPRGSLGRALSKRGGLGRLLTLGRRESLEMALSTRSPGVASSARLRYEIEIAASGVGHSIVREELTEERGKRRVPLFQREGTSARVSSSTARKASPQPKAPDSCSVRRPTGPRSSWRRNLPLCSAGFLQKKSSSPTWIAVYAH